MDLQGLGVSEVFPGSRAGSTVKDLPCQVTLVDPGLGGSHAHRLESPGTQLLSLCSRAVSHHY